MNIIKPLEYCATNVWDAICAIIMALAIVLAVALFSMPEDFWYMLLPNSDDDTNNEGDDE